MEQGERGVDVSHPTPSGPDVKWRKREKPAGWTHIFPPRGTFPYSGVEWSYANGVHSGSPPSRVLLYLPYNERRGHPPHAPRIDVLTRSRPMNSSWNRWISRLIKPKTRSVSKRTPGRLRLESLEERLSPATNIWTGGGGNTFWNTPANWSAGHVPQPNEDIEFGAAAPIGSRTT